MCYKAETFEYSTHIVYVRALSDGLLVVINNIWVNGKQENALVSAFNLRKYQELQP